MEELRVKKCFDVTHELEKASIQMRVDVRTLFYNVIGVYTFISEDEDGIRTELSEARSKDFFSSKTYEDRKYFIFQAYDLVIKKRKERAVERFKIDLEEQDSQLVLSFSSENLDWILENLGEVQRAIHRKKAFLGVIFKDFSISFDAEELRKKITSAEKWIGEIRKVVLEKSDYYQPLRDGYFLFKLQKEWEYRSKMQYENSSYAVKSGMEVGRLYKGKKGYDGRNLRGKYIINEKREPEELEIGFLDGDFILEDCGDYTLFNGNKQGFVGFNSSGLVLIKDTSFEELSHRNIGNLLGGLECGMELNVRASNPEKDAVCAGIILEAKKLTISGSIDQGSKIKAEHCVISGFTHQNVEIYGKEVEVDILKGKVCAERIKVRMCEGGHIDCGEGEIAESIGAEIKGKTIRIKTMHSNNKVYISSRLEIKEMKGGGNYLCIDSSAFLDYREEIDRIKKKREKYLDSIVKLSKIYKVELVQAKKMKPAVEQFKTIYQQNLQKGIQTQPYILITLGEYVNLMGRLKVIKAKMEQCQKRADDFLEEIKPLTQISIEGKIECESEWVDQNQVEFVDITRDERETMIIEDGERVNISINPNTLKLVKERI